jgi:hypothetical protein
MPNRNVPDESSPVAFGQLLRRRMGQMAELHGKVSSAGFNYDFARIIIRELFFALVSLRIIWIVV